MATTTGRGRRRTSAAHLRAELVQKLIAIIGSQGPLGPSAYPLTVARLAELAGHSPDDPAFVSAVNSKAFKDKAIVALPSGKDKARRLLARSLVALIEDIETLASADRLLEFLFDVAGSPTIRAFSATALRNALTGAGKKRLQKAFESAFAERVRSGRLPAWIGWIPIKSDHYFRIDDVRPAGIIAGGRTDVAAAPAAKPAQRPFDQAFDEAFARLDRATGSRNFLKLAQLRLALPEYDRRAFDQGLRQLRIEGRYALDAADGVGTTLTAEERDAAIVEAGSILAYVSRR